MPPATAGSRAGPRLQEEDAEGSRAPGNPASRDRVVACVPLASTAAPPLGRVPEGPAEPPKVAPHT